MINRIIKSLIIFSLFATAAAEEKNILFLGDSLTAGYGLEKEQAFPQLIKNSLDKKGIKSKVINAGESGHTSAGGVRRVNWYFKKRIDILVLALGANDGLRGLPVKSTETNLQKIIDLAKKNNPKMKVIIAGMKVPPNMGKEYSKEFEALYPKLARKNSCILIPFLLEKVAGYKEHNLPDGIHPNIKGHKIIAENVMKFITQALKAGK